VTLALVLVGGAVGAPLRYVIDVAVQARHGSLFPWGTFAVNVIGSFVLGVVLGGAAAGALPPAAVTLLGTGVCGAFTTFSTFGFETVRLLEKGAFTAGVLNALLSLAVGMAAALAGWGLAAALDGILA